MASAVSTRQSPKPSPSGEGGLLPILQMSGHQLLGMRRVIPHSNFAGQIGDSFHHVTAHLQCVTVLSPDDRRISRKKRQSPPFPAVSFKACSVSRLWQPQGGREAKILSSVRSLPCRELGRASHRYTSGRLERHRSRRFREPSRRIRPPSSAQGRTSRISQRSLNFCLTRRVSVI